MSEIEGSRSTLIIEREFTFSIEGRRLTIPARIAPAHVWFATEESHSGRWLTTDIGDGKVLALRATLHSHD
jgi:hypothetical protein